MDVWTWNRTVRGLTAQVERVTLREQAHAALLTREVESVTRRAEAFIAEHRSEAAASPGSGAATSHVAESEEEQSMGASAEDDYQMAVVDS